jgi:hypothetical protein
MSIPQTAYGWSFVFSLFFTIWLVRQTVKKSRRTGGATNLRLRATPQSAGKDQSFGCLSTGILSLILGSMSFLFFPFLFLFLQTNYQYLTLEQYQATIVAIESKWEREDYTDSDNRRQTRNVLMHTSIVEFTDAQLNVVRIPSSIRSGEAPVIGDQLRVAYIAGMQMAAEVSFRAFALQFGLLIMLLILGFCLLLIARWTLDKSNERLAGLGINILLNIGVPLAMIGMEAGFLYGLKRHFSGEKDLPMWTVGLLICFSLALGIAIIGYLKNIWWADPADKLVSDVLPRQNKLPHE